MTPTQFAQQHGDPATWTTNDVEAQQNLAAIDHHDTRLAAAAVDLTLRMRLSPVVPDPIRTAA